MSWKFLTKVAESKEIHSYNWGNNTNCNRIWKRNSGIRIRIKTTFMKIQNHKQWSISSDSNNWSSFQSNMLFVNLAFSDLAIITCKGPLMVINAFTSRFWLYGVFMCKLYGCLGGVFGTCSLVTLVFIGYDRYLLVCYGTTNSKMNWCRVLCVLIFIWGYSIGASIGPFYGWGKYTMGKDRFVYILFSHFILCSLHIFVYNNI